MDKVSSFCTIADDSRDHIRSYPVATGADSRPDTRPEVFGATTRIMDESLHRRPDNAISHTAPSGMGQPDGPVDGVPEQQGDTIRETEEQNDPGCGGQQTVGSVLDGAPMLPPDRPDMGAVDLIRADNLVSLYTEEGKNPSVVLLDRLQVIANRVAQIEGGEGSLTYATQAGQDRVGQASAVQSLKAVEDYAAG